MKRKLLVLILTALMVTSVFFVGGCSSDDTKTLHIYNWGEYIDEELVTAFEEETGIEVIYSEFASNEEMYTKIKAGGGDYDLIFPSDYMIERMIDEDLLAEINFDNIPSFSDVIPAFVNPAYDPYHKYSVPYMWGTVGIMYNTEIVTEPVDSWAILWDEKYENSIMMYDSSRDSFMVALSYLGYDINSTNPDEIAEAEQLLKDQKPLLLSYVLDDVKDKMVSGEAALGVGYSGYMMEILWEMEEEGTVSNVGYVIPKEGSNVWVDAMAIPKTSENKEEAEAFIEFITKTDNALQNTEWIGYSTPLASVKDSLDIEITSNEWAYPSDEVLANCDTFKHIGDDIKLYDDAWVRIKAE